MAVAVSQCSNVVAHSGGRDKNGGHYKRDWNNKQIPGTWHRHRDKHNNGYSTSSDYRAVRNVAIAGGVVMGIVGAVKVFSLISNKVENWKTIHDRTDFIANSDIHGIVSNTKINKYCFDVKHNTKATLALDSRSEYTKYDLVNDKGYGVKGDANESSVMMLKQGKYTIAVSNYVRAEGYVLRLETEEPNSIIQCVKEDSKIVKVKGTVKIKPEVKIASGNPFFDSSMD